MRIERGTGVEIALQSFLRGLRADAVELANAYRQGIPPEKLPEIAALLPHWPREYKPRIMMQDGINIGMWGGRGGGKSHAAAEFIVAAMVACPDLLVVCVREVQKSLKYSSKLLIENKIQQLGWSDKFEVFYNEIRRKDGNGLIVFQGMQDHTAESVKSLEGFGLCWVEEAASLSAYSLKLLIPTIRVKHSRLLFTWNPDLETAAVDKMFRKNPPSGTISTGINWRDNVFITDELLAKKDALLEQDPQEYLHVWEGGYSSRTETQVFGGKWEIKDFTPNAHWDGPYFGADWGDTDPTCCVKLWLDENSEIHIEYESHHRLLDLDDIADQWRKDIPNIASHTIRADNSQPKTIRHVSSHGLNVVPAPKWPGSISDGIKWMRSKGIVVHSRCVETIKELQLYQWKTNRAGDILDTAVDKDNHLCDSTRYALAPLITASNNTGHIADATPTIEIPSEMGSTVGGLVVPDF